MGQGLIDLGSLATADDLPLTSFLDQVCARFGVDYAAYAGANPLDGTVHAHATYPDNWKAHYLEAGLHRFDPTLHAARHSIAPVDWGCLDREAPGFDTVFRTAHDFGISTQGLTIPVRGPYGDIGMLSVTRNCPPEEWRRLVRHMVGDLQSVSVFIHDAVMQTDTLGRLLRHPALSTREREILQWVAAGKSQQDVADILSISPRTVDVHLRSAREKLGALTTPQAVARAVTRGLIYPG